MKYWLVIDKAQAGPFDLEQLANIPFNESTPAWHEGLPQWIPASDIPDLNAILLDRRRLEQEAQARCEQERFAEYQQQQRMNVQQQYHQPAAQMNQQPAQRPSNSLAWAIVATILCCLPFGIIAIFYAVSVNNKFDRGDYEGARRASDMAQLWIILSIVFGLLAIPFQILWMLL